MLIIDILTIQNCNYCIVGFGLILILTTNIEILSRASVYIHIYIIHMRTSTQSDKIDNHTMIE